MKLIRIFALFIMCAVLLSLSGCKKDSVTNPFDNISTTENAPTYSNNTNSFKYSITANSFTHNYEYLINMNTQTLGIAVTVTNYSRGNVVMELYSDTNAKVFSRDLSTNNASSDTYTFDSHISRIDIHFTSFTATFNCALTAK